MSENTDKSEMLLSAEAKKARRIFESGKMLVNFNLTVFLWLAAVWAVIIVGYMILGNIMGLIAFIVSTFSIMSVFPALVIATVGVAMLSDAKKRGQDGTKDYIVIGIVEILYNLGWIAFYLVGFFTGFLVE